MTDSVAPAQAIQVKVLSAEGCMNTPPTVERILEVAATIGLKVHLETVLVATPEEATRHRFFGSPTVQVNGLDLEPAMRNQAKICFS